MGGREEARGIQAGAGGDGAMASRAHRGAVRRRGQIDEAQVVRQAAVAHQIVGGVVGAGAVAGLAADAVLDDRAGR